MTSSRRDRDAKQLKVLEQRLGYTFSEHSILKRALTHASLRRDSGEDFHYERLEFLGDRVLGLCVAQMLFQEFSEAREGELSLRFNSLVKGKTLTEIADELQLHEFIRTGGDLKKITGKRMQSVRADVLEALIAAIYLDGGLEATREFIHRFWNTRLKDTNAARRDSKTALQEWAHAERLGTPRYKEKSRSGPDHDPVFTVTVKVPDLDAAAGTGRSKRLAEQEAAKNFLVREGIWKDNSQDDLSS